MNDFKDRHISLLKDELTKALSKECPKPDWWDRFGYGFVASSIIFIIGVIIGVAL